MMIEVWYSRVVTLVLIQLQCYKNYTVRVKHSLDIFIVENGFVLLGLTGLQLNGVSVENGIVSL